MTPRDVAKAKAVQLAYDGLTCRQIGDALGYSHRRVQGWCREDRDFQRRMHEAWRSAARNRPEVLAFAAAIGAGESVTAAARRLRIPYGRANSWCQPANGFDVVLAAKRRAGHGQRRWTEEMADEALALIASGVPVRAAAAAVGGRPSIFWNWKRSRPDLYARYRAALAAREAVAA